MTSRRVRRLLWVLAVCVLGVLGLRAFVFDLFQVTSSSMEPWVRPGEVVLVALHDRSRPDHNEPVVFERGDGFLVKRAAGVGGSLGEELWIDTNGDLKVNGEYRPEQVDGPRVLIFDQARHQIDQHFARGSSRGDPWRERGEGLLELDAREIERGRQAGLLRYHLRLLDHYLDRAGELVQGQHSVHDAAVEFELRPLEAGGLVRVGLVEEGDTFWLVVEPGVEQGSIRILRDDGTSVRTLAERPFTLPVGEWIEVAFANVDNRLSARLGQETLQVVYELNTPVADRRAPVGTSIGERVKLGGEGCLLELRGLRLWRDLHYTARGRYAVGTRYMLPAGQLFMLGDNSAHSRDSREFGPIDESQVVGRPVMVVWPPAAIRWLR